MQPGQFNPKGEDWIARKFAELEKQIRELKAANPYAPMGMTPMEGGVSFDGNMRVAGTLDLPAGIINNDALANPVTATVVNTGVIGFGLAINALQQKLSTTVAVPEGFTKALVIAYADMTAANSTAVDDYAFISVKIAGVAPTYAGGTNAPPSRFAYCGSSFTRVLTGLSGSFDITVEAGSDRAPWAADPTDNVINLNAMVTFLR